VGWKGSPIRSWMAARRGMRAPIGNDDSVPRSRRDDEGPGPQSQVPGPASKGSMPDRGCGAPPGRAPGPTRPQHRQSGPHRCPIDPSTPNWEAVALLQVGPEQRVSEHLRLSHGVHYRGIGPEKQGVQIGDMVGAYQQRPVRGPGPAPELSPLRRRTSETGAASWTGLPPADRAASVEPQPSGMP